MAKTEGSDRPTPKKNVRRKSRSATAAETDSLDKPSLDADNPGLLLADLVDGSIDLRRISNEQTSPTKRPKVLKKKARKGLTKDNQEDGPDSKLLEEDDEDADDERIEATMKLLGTVQRLADDEASAVTATRRLQAQPESEFNAGSVDEEVTIEDLLKPITEGTSFSDVRKQLEGLATREAMPEPVPEVKRTREERSVQYQATSRDVKKWIPQVQRMTRADQVVLEQEDATIKATECLVSSFEASNDFEKELEEITRAAGATEEDLKGAKILPMNRQLREHSENRQVARLKALMLREQQASKRVKKIKSKTYRRIHRKSETKEREVLLERLEHENPELAKQLRQEYEKKYAEKRLLRNRNARKKWAQTMQRFAKGDRNAQQEITKQAQQAHDDEKALRRAIRGQDPDQSDDSEAIDLSGSDDEDNKGSTTRKTLTKAKKLTVEEIRNLDVEGDLPTKGLLGMKFMREAIKSKREVAKQEAQNVLKELEGMEKRLDDYKDSDDDKVEFDDKSKTPGGTDSKKAKLPKFTPEELAKASAEVDQILEDEDNVTGCSVAGPLTVHGVHAAAVVPAPKKHSKKVPPGSGKAKQAAEDTASTNEPATASRPAAQKVDNPWDAAWTSAQESANETKETHSTEADKVPNASEKKQTKRKRTKPDAEHREKVATSAEQRENEDILAALSFDSAKAQEQRELVRTTFIEGTQEDDFEAEAEEESQKKEKKATGGDLPGWGSWAGTGAPTRKPPPVDEEAKKAEAARKKPGVIFYGGQAENAKYFVDKVPYGFRNPEQYNQELRMPSGPEWNALPVHLQRIKPKFFSKVGAIVPPLQFVKHLPRESREGVIEQWAKAKQPKRLKAKI